MSNRNERQPVLPSCRRLFLLIVFLIIANTFSIHAGVALRLYYYNIAKSDVASLTNHPAFPRQPTSAEPVTAALEKLNESGDRFGTWTRGYLQAPQAGAFTFMLASDDASEFWLSSDHSKQSLRKILENTKWVKPRDFTAKDSLQSASVSLEKGRLYYFELFHREYQGADHVSVGWKLPDGTVEAPIPATRFLPVPVDAQYQPVEKAPAILTEYFDQPVATLSNVSVWEGESVEFTVTAEATPPVTFQWFRNNEPIPGANLSTYSLPKATLLNDVDLFAVVVSNRLGQARGEAVLSVLPDNIPPTVASVINRTDSLAVFFSKPMDPVSASQPENYLINGKPVQKAIVSADRKEVHLQAASAFSSGKQQLLVQNVKDIAEPPNTIPSASFTIESSLKVWLKFDDLDATKASDSSGNDFNATCFNSPIPTADGKVNRCFRFDGEDDYAMLADGAYDFSRGLTIAVWARPTAVMLWARFIDFGNGASSDNFMLGRRQASNDLFWQSYHGKTSKGQVIATDAIELDRWQHFAVTVNETGRTALYKDGVLLNE